MFSNFGPLGNATLPGLRFRTLQTRAFSSLALSHPVLGRASPVPRPVLARPCPALARPRFKQSRFFDSTLPTSKRAEEKFTISQSLREFPVLLSGILPSHPFAFFLGAHEGGRALEKGVFLPSKRLVESPFLEPLLRTLLRTPPPSKTHCKTPSENPSWNLLENNLENPSKNPS